MDFFTAFPLLIGTVWLWQIKTLWPMRKTSIETAGLFIASFGVIGFLAPFSLLAGGNIVPQALELPNSLDSSAVQLTQGQIAVVSPSLSRIQFYDNNGQFIRGFHVNTAGGPVSLIAGEDGRIHVCPSKIKSDFVVGIDSGIQPSKIKCEYAQIPAETHDIRQGWLAWLLVPLWHPVLAWIIAVIGIIMAYRLFSRLRENSAKST